eukprot:TRINITY_DN5740_c0_g1_i3.p1 TRINITY_DN5740_c0_g1~~TRINITY_DN5740_c0_g1_i3.p1  ORF type:complete len:245 (+),score=31.58 TRINITY_DN5740_c0_g1_i3:43-777(+)
MGVLEGISPLIVQLAHTLKTSDSHIRNLDLLGINITGSKTYEQYYNEFVSTKSADVCLDKKIPNTETATYDDVKEVFYIFACAIGIGMVLTIISNSFSNWIEYWNLDELAGRQYIILLDSVTAITNRYLIGSMVRIHDVSRPKNLHFLAHIRNNINPKILRAVMKTLKEEERNKKKTIKNKTSKQEIENSSLSALEITICGKIIKSTSLKVQLELSSVLNRICARRRWIFTTFYFALPCERWKF